MPIIWSLIPGAERPLKTEDDFKAAVGRYIHVTFWTRWKYVYDGTLKELTDEKWY